ncbi:hypothetical protein B0I35DRAFT_363556 [Stachybotrys elegans]|uniref:Uncharacterized protein n=1 Tax=Stachybotrys elegans TaxID=80388 RepID=A0A8K0SEL4_9HYPO|nr:hypothetical protein B0I35DRAFT_363556 [Stachybotrys elegans]
MRRFQTGPPPTSILELLTHPNPPVNHANLRSTTNTRHAFYHFPREIRPWTEFSDISLLKHLDESNLFREACQQRQGLPAYPTMFHDTDCQIRGEPATEHVLSKWTSTIVMSGLDPIQSLYNPARWAPGEVLQRQASERPEVRGKKRSQPSRKCAERSKRKRTYDLSKLRPDSGSSRTEASESKAPTEADSDTKLYTAGRERFPKEYKPAQKWKSSHLYDLNLIDENGEWNDSKEFHNSAMPVRQAYSYCIQTMCRYGCILSCHEAFIFRIKPRRKGPEDTTHLTQEELESKLISDGMMEFVSIPWSNYYIGPQETLNDWTVNLALWFVHVLAGDEFEASWTYSPLASYRDGATAAIKVNSDTMNSEEPDTVNIEQRQGDKAPESDSTLSDNSDAAMLNRKSNKRKREVEGSEEEEEDLAHFSFHKRLFYNS